MTMIDMKMSPEEAKEQTEPSALTAPKYPYGLSICLDDESLKKLGLTALPVVGSKVSFNAVAEVCSTSQYQDQSGEAETSLSLQITGMEIISGAQPSADAARALYGD